MLIVEPNIIKNDFFLLEIFYKNIVIWVHERLSLVERTLYKGLFGN